MAFWVEVLSTSGRSPLLGRLACAVPPSGPATVALGGLQCKHTGTCGRESDGSTVRVHWVAQFRPMVQRAFGSTASRLGRRYPDQASGILSSNRDP
jgi:hypothetical protein